MESYEHSQATIEASLLRDDAESMFQQNAFAVGVCQNENLELPAGLVLTSKPGNLYRLQLWRNMVQGFENITLQFIPLTGQNPALLYTIGQSSLAQLSPGNEVISVPEHIQLVRNYVRHATWDSAASQQAADSAAEAFDNSPQ